MDKLKLEEFQEYLSSRTRPNTAKTYMCALRHWLTWLNGQPVSEKTAQMYVDMLEHEHKSPNTIATAANAIRKWSKWRGARYDLDSPKIILGEPSYIEMVNVEKLINACETSLERAVITCLFDTALRASEFWNIEISDVDWDRGLIRVTRKGGRVGDVNVSEKAMETLREWLNTRKSDSKRVFMDLTYNDLWLIVKRIGKKAGMNIHPHQFRHSRAVQLLDDGVDMYVVQQHMGHTNIGTTMNIYGRLRPMKLKEKLTSW